ncbi:FKBP-type peptidyl-prolyl cis-trans isomerase [Thiolapillus brandeum]|uniref:Peptidyl-prolyl cis-trans isomerase n=1 Tax=Thiolapillus brandeum TaxID=1076588 RepID=A0A7U6GHY1_9GAMM|nr:FKBP-type peptidyl-prolyl cis-trans isomerase [Thiolapillus brandeum]BAO43968.1 FKBP-type peptidyl-prolyl cis-trans isomerase FklB [Thiolapillus brandeum]
MKKKPIVLMLAAVVLGGQVQATELKTFDQRFSYTLGVRMAKMLSAQGIGKLDGPAFGSAVADVINGKDLQMTEDQMTEVLKERSDRLNKERKAKAAAALEKGKKFLADNARNEGVKVTDSGLQYKVIREGKGDSPKKTDRVKVHYEGRTIDGKKFDSSYDRGKPAEFGVSGVVKGFSEALQLMKPGAKYQVFIPSELGYGERGAGKVIGPNEVLVFDLELLEVLPEKKPEPAAADAGKK